ncbi:hypothetical protein A2U01_0040670, partial [Trifolium medium]|nr:hypothetical protein [Trifolium medium]
MERIESLEKSMEEMRMENRQLLDDAMAELRAFFAQNNHNRCEEDDAQ